MHQSRGRDQAVALCGLAGEIAAGDGKRILAEVDTLQHA
jgi:hypothetical protein